MENNIIILNKQLITALKLKEINAAGKIVNSLESIGVKNPEILVNIGNYFAALPDTHTAVKKYKEALLMYPFQLQALKNLKTIYKKANNLQLAVSVQANLDTINEFTVKDYCNYFRQFQNENKQQASLYLIKEGLVKFPGDRVLQKYLIFAYFSIEQNEKVISYGTLFLEKQEDAEINHLLGTVFLSQKKYSAALQYLDKALLLSPANINVLIKLSKLFAFTCSWYDFNKVQEKITFLLSTIQFNEEYALDVYDFVYLDIPQRILSDINIRKGKWLTSRLTKLKNKYSANMPALQQNHKIRIGYLSPNFKNHPGGYIQYEIPGAHTKDKFEVFVYMTAPETGGDYYNSYVKNHTSNYRNIFGYSTENACDIIYSDRIDFLIDMGGHQKYARPDILACRPAKKQAHYVGYANPLGKDLIDYFITDKVMVPLTDKEFFTEDVLYINTNFRIGELAPGQKKFFLKDFQLDENAFVLMAMNSVYKIDAALFSIWMQLLHDFPSAVLFLLDDNEQQVNNMKTFAAQKGINPGKQIRFIKSTANATDFIELLKLANLYLDTPRYPVSSTGAVLVKANLAFISIFGKKIVQRGGASILASIGREDLIVKTPEEYYLKNKAIISVALPKNERVLLNTDAAGIKGDNTNLPAFIKKLEAEILQSLV